MRIVGRTHSRTYRPELCISIRAFGAQAFIVTGFGAQTVTEHGFKTWHNFAPCIILHFA